MKKVTLIISLVICYLVSFSQKYGTFTDPRDGKVYKTVKIGTQLVMAENLAYKPDKGTYWIYKYDSNNIEKFEYRYDWVTANSIAPVGWHLPTREEWRTLWKYLGGDATIVYNAMKAGGSSGFNAILTGFYLDTGENRHGGERAYFWSSSPQDREHSWVMFCKTYKYRGKLGPLATYYGLAVRLFADNPDSAENNY